MTPTDEPPRISTRTRLFRPDVLTDDVTGTLEPQTLLAYLGLATRADDAGFLVWRPIKLAAEIRPYADPGERTRDLEQASAALVEAGLLQRYACGCALLPRMVRDLAIKGGSKTNAIRDWHQAHSPDASGLIPIRTDASGQSRSDPAESVSATGSGSSSRSESGSSSGPGSAAGTESGSGRERGWSDAEWIDQLHRLGMAFDREVDATWPAWLASLRRRHADQNIYDAIRAVTETGERRPALVKDLVQSNLGSGVDQPRRKHVA